MYTDFNQSKARTVCDFLFVSHCDYGSIYNLATYWVKIAYFFYPSLIRRPRSLCALWNFAVKLTMSGYYCPVLRCSRSWYLPRLESQHDCTFQDSVEWLSAMRL